MISGYAELHLDPLVYIIDDFISDEECNSLIALGGQNNMGRALVSGKKEGVISRGRTNDLCWLDHNINSTTQHIAERISGLVGMPLSHAERLQLIRYSEDTEYRAHFDAFDAKTGSGKRNMENGSQRQITVLGYLNTVSEGGATRFPKLDINVSAKKGRLLIFYNCKHKTETRHPKSLHAGLPVTQGEKWAFNLWFRTNPRYK